MSPKVDKIKDKLSEKIIEFIANEIPEVLEKFFVRFNDPKFVFKLGFWHEKISPIPDLDNLIYGTLCQLVAVFTKL